MLRIPEMIECQKCHLKWAVDLNAVKLCGCERDICKMCTCPECRQCFDCCNCDLIDTYKDVPVVTHQVTEKAVMRQCVKCDCQTTHFITTIEGEEADEYIWCRECLNLVDEDSAQTEDALAEHTIEAHCGECKRRTTHSDSPYVSAWICTECKYVNPNVKTPLPAPSMEDPNPTYAPPACTSNYSGYNYSGWRDCEHNRSPVQVGNWTMLASGSMDRGTAFDSALIPDYGVYLSPTWASHVVATLGFPTDELGVSEEFPSLHYPWTDMGSPRHPEIVRIVKWIAKSVRAGKVIEIGCMGGHGRTGTLLALVLMEIERLSPASAIAAVRSRHCKNAIETYTQERFIYLWGGEEPPAQPVTTSPNRRPFTSAAAPSHHGYRYSSKKERNRMKRQRKTRRQEWRKSLDLLADKWWVSDPKPTWDSYRIKEIERNSTLWSCTYCGSINESFIAKAIEVDKDSLREMYCKDVDCHELRLHTRPVGLDRA